VYSQGLYFLVCSPCLLHVLGWSILDLYASVTCLMHKCDIVFWFYVDLIRQLLLSLPRCMSRSSLWELCGR
jgi:hypothetical protein